MENIVYKRGIIVGEDETVSEEIEIDESRMVKLSAKEVDVRFDDAGVYISERAGGKFEGKALYLPKHYDWVLCKDSEGVTCLVPLKKENK